MWLLYVLLLMPPAEPPSIGVASMRDDRTIVLELRASGPATGDALFTYAPDHPEYSNVLEHLGGLEPGETKPVPPWPNPVLEALDRLEASLPLSRETVQEIFEVELRERRATRYFRFFDGSAEADGLAAVELRLPLDGSRRGLLVLDVAPDIDLREEDLRERYSAEPALEVPSPTAPPTAPLGYRFARPWGRLTFGVSRTGDAEGRLVRITLSEQE